MTATTPSMRAVRFETGLIELELSNRIQTKAKPGSRSYLKLFGKCQVDLNLALGQIVKHQVSSRIISRRVALLQPTYSSDTFDKKQTMACYAPVNVLILRFLKISN